MSKSNAQLSKATDTFKHWNEHHAISPTLLMSNYVHRDFVHHLQHGKIHSISLQNEHPDLLVFYTVSDLG